MKFNKTVTTFELNEQELEVVVSIVCSFGVFYSGVFKVGCLLIGRLRFTFMADGKRGFAPRDQVLSLHILDCSLLLVVSHYFHP